MCWAHVTKRRQRNLYVETLEMNLKCRFRKQSFKIRFCLETASATFLTSFFPGINLELSSLSKKGTTFSEN